jgi:PAS domain S-box-containing protein
MQPRGWSRMGAIIVFGAAMACLALALYGTPEVPPVAPTLTAGLLLIVISLTAFLLGPAWGIAEAALATGLAIVYALPASQAPSRFPFVIAVAALFFLAGVGFAWLGDRHRLRTVAGASGVRQEDEPQAWAALLEAMPEAMLIADSDRRIVATNAAAERLLGWRAGEAVGRLCCDLLPAEAASYCQAGCALLQAIESGIGRQLGPLPGGPAGGQAGETSPGLTRQVTLQVTPIRGRDGIRHALVMVQHLQPPTDRDQVEPGFVASLAHEMRSRLAGIAASAELLLAGGLEEKVYRDVLTVMRAQSLRSAQFFEYLMDAERLQAGIVALQPEPVALLPLIRGVIADFEAAGTARRFALVHDGGLPFALADEERTEAVLYNLIDNAVKYSADGSTISVEVREESPRSILITVRDQGAGIPADQIPLLFQPFHRADGARGTYGHGLGLYIAKGFVEAQGGRIWVESRIGSGSAFHFTLPRVEDEAES